MVCSFNNLHNLLSALNNIMCQILQKQMNESFSEDDRYEELLDYVAVVSSQIRKLLKRENLCNNTYLYKKMNINLMLPLYIIADQRNVSSISRNYDDIIDALENSGLAHVINGREVRIVENPTVKINIANHEALREIQKILEEKDKKYEISKRVDTDQYVNLTVFSQNIIWLEKLLQNIDKEIDFQKVTLINDIKIGVDRIRKLKFDHARAKTATGRVKYSVYNPPEVFVRKALEDSDTESDDEDHANGTNGAQKKGNKRYAGNGRGNRKPRLHNQDFPELK